VGTHVVDPVASLRGGHQHRGTGQARVRQQRLDRGPDLRHAGRSHQVHLGHHGQAGFQAEPVHQLEVLDGLG
jgi:hypothetical protein